MNRWDCQMHGCRSQAVGAGGAIGLRAIGWYFETGPILFCPAHRPDATTERTPLHCRSTDDGQPCPWCTADREASRYQVAMGGGLDLLEEAARGE
jgi:hypothetical protein